MIKTPRSLQVPFSTKVLWYFPCWRCLYLKSFGEIHSGKMSFNINHYIIQLRVDWVYSGNKSTLSCSKPESQSVMVIKDFGCSFWEQKKQSVDAPQVGSCFHLLSSWRHTSLQPTELKWRLTTQIYSTWICEWSVQRGLFQATAAKQPEFQVVIIIS